MLPFDLEQTIRRSIRWSLVGSVGLAVLQLLQSVVFARFTDPGQVGDYTLAATVVAFLTPLADAGLSQAVVQARELHPTQMATLGWVNFVMCLLLFLLLAAGGTWLGHWYGRPDLSGLLLLMGSSLLLTPFGAMYGALLLRDLRFDWSTRIELAGAVMSLVVVVTLAWHGWGAWAMAWSFWCKNAISLLGAWWATRRSSNLNWFKISPLRAVFPSLRFGSFELGARFADAASNYTDKLIVGKWLGTAALAHYSQAFALYLIPTSRVGFVVTRVAFPVFARLQDDPAALQAFFDRTNRQLQWLLVPLYVGLMLFSDEIVWLLYGPAWQAMSPLLIAFGAAGLVRSLSAIFPMLTRGVGKPEWQLFFMLTWTLALNVTLVAALYFFPDTTAAVWTRFPAKLLFEIPLLVFLARRCGVDFGATLRLAAVVWLKVATAALLALGLTWALQLSFWPEMALKGLVYGAVLLLFWRESVRE